MELIFLGTTCMVPTKDRNHPGLLLKYSGEGLLFDCGEGTQRQIKLAGAKITDINKIFISHWHGDHVLGLPGLLQSLNASDYTKKLQIFGPTGTKTYFDHLMKAFVFDNQLDMEIIEVDEKEDSGKALVDNKKYTVQMFEMDHGMPAMGFKFIEKDRRRINLAYTKSIGLPEGPLMGKLQRGEEVEFNGQPVTLEKATHIVKGKIIGIITDTVNCKGCYQIAEDADLLVSEASFAKDLLNKAEDNKHMTAEQAAQIASQEQVGELILTHFSARYKTSEQIEKEAQDVFPNTRCAYDLMKIRL